MGAGEHHSGISIHRPRIRAARASGVEQASPIRFHVYLLPSNVQLKNKTSATEESLTAEVSSGGSWVAAKVVKTHGPVGENIEVKHDRDVADREYSFIFYEIIEN